jgi:hypothetical protein
MIATRSHSPPYFLQFLIYGLSKHMIVYLEPLFGSAHLVSGVLHLISYAGINTILSYDLSTTQVLQKIQQGYYKTLKTC